MAVVQLSPEMPRVSVRGHKREPSEPLDFLSASYPLGTADGGTADDAPGQLQRSYSGRPRSQSQFLALTSNAKQRKSLRSLSRRGASVSWINKAAKQQSSGEAGGNRRSSTTDAENATTEQIDSAFTKIKEQLARLSEEDQVLKDRVDKLNEEINILNSTPVRRKSQQRLPARRGNASPSWKKSAFFSATISEGDYPSRVPVLLVSSSSRDNQLGCSVHETITEQSSDEVQSPHTGTGEGGGLVPRGESCCRDQQSGALRPRGGVQTSSSTTDSPVKHSLSTAPEIHVAATKQYNSHDTAPTHTGKHTGEMFQLQPI